MADTDFDAYPDLAPVATDKLVALRGAGGINPTMAQIAAFAAANAGDGTVAAPGLSFASDPDTGIYRAGANLLGIVTTGVERVRIDASGNVGIGNTSPGTRLHVTSSVAKTLQLASGVAGAPANMDAGEVVTISAAAVSGMTFSGSDGRLLTLGVSPDNSVYLRALALNLNATNDLILSPGAAEKVRVTSGGKVGIGTSSPAETLHLYNSNSANWVVQQLQNGAGIMKMGVWASAGDAFVEATTAGKSLIFLVAGAEKARVDSSNSFAWRAGSDNAQDLGTAAIRWAVVRAGTGTISTSDERTKQSIECIPDEWLDAWGALGWVRYKFRDAVEVKGDDARWHVGLIAQRVRDAFASAGLDALAIGLLCYDEWEEQREPIVEERQIDVESVIVDRVDTGLFDASGNHVFRDVTENRPIMGMVDTGVTRVTLEAGNRWGLRYDECQAMEAAWQRREIAQLTERLAALEAAA